MSQSRSLIVVGVIALLVLAIVLGTIFYLTRAFHSTPTRVATNHVVTPTAQPTLPISTSTATPGPSAAPLVTQAPNPDFKLYNGQAFQIQYPKSWGILTCSNSSNIEFDPTNSTDQLNVKCGLAVKPITVLVNNSTYCYGQKATIGAIPVVEHTKTYSDGEKDYVWCTQLQPLLNISTRTSQNSSRATSPVDYSTQVEQMISTLHYGNNS